MKKLLATLLILLSLTACRKACVPETFRELNDTAHIYPEYHEVTIPANIAPLRFHIEEEGREFVTRLTADGCQLTFEGRDVCPSLKEWKKLTSGQQSVCVEIFVKGNDGSWTRMCPFHIYISPDEINPYLAYRLIAPSYITYEGLTICQRNLTNYDERVIYGNMINSTEAEGQCINCHAFQNYNPERMQFHVRQSMGGTVIRYDGETRKVDMKTTDSLLSSGVYPAWHPTEKLIAYSTNMTSQLFHTRDVQKVEVQDTYSDLILYDLERNEVISLPRDSNRLDCFPSWSPDGRTLYYCSARYIPTDTLLPRPHDMTLHYDSLRYNIMARTFDASTRRFGEEQIVFDAASIGKSATLPRISPDGNWMLFTMARYGIFHIWHHDADLYLMNLQTGQTRPLDGVNSPEVESYHSWSGNGRWIVFSSRRDDGNYTRPFFVHIDAEGHTTKPFEIPSRVPLYNRQLLRSYNIPEFIDGPVTVSPQELARVIQRPPLQAH